MRLCSIVVFLFSFGVEGSLYAQPRHLYSSAAVSGMHLPVWSAKDLGLFHKYGLNVDVVVISGVAFLRRRPEYRGGMDHFGFEVDDIESVCARIKEKYPAIGVVKRPAARTFAAYSTHDLEGKIFDLAQPSGQKRYQNWAGQQTPPARYISHFTIRAMNPAALADFYLDAYGLQTEWKALEDPNFYLTDGKVTLVLAPWKIEDYRATEHRGPGLDHVGFKVESLDAFKQDVEILREVDPEWLSPQTPNLVSEHKVVVALLASCRHGQHQVADPEGNFLDVSE